MSPDKWNPTAGGTDARERRLIRLVRDVERLRCFGWSASTLILGAALGWAATVAYYEGAWTWPW